MSNSTDNSRIKYDVQISQSGCEKPMLPNSNQKHETDVSNQSKPFAPKQVEISARTGKPKRRKAVRACTNCQRTHLTCDDNRPCERCVKRGCQDTCQDGIRKKSKHRNTDDVDNKERNSAHNTKSLMDAGHPHQTSQNADTMFLQNIQGNSDLYSNYQYAFNQNLQFPGENKYVTDQSIPSSRPDLYENPPRYSPNDQSSYLPLSPTDMLYEQDVTKNRLQKDYRNSQSYYDSFSSYTHNKNAYPLHHKYPHHHHRHKNNVPFNPSDLFGEESDSSRDLASISAEDTNDLSLRPIGSTSISGKTSDDDVSNKHVSHTYSRDNNNFTQSDKSLTSTTDSVRNTLNYKRTSGAFNHSEQFSDAQESSSSNDEPDKKESIFGWSNPPPNPLTLAHIEHSSHMSYGYKLDPNEVYQLATEPYPYREKMNELINFLFYRLSKEDFAKLHDSLRKIKASFQYIHKSLSKEDVLFIERSFQRSVLEEEKQFALINVPCLVWRWTGQIAAVSPKFSKLVDKSADELKKLLIFDVIDNRSIMNYFQNLKPMSQSGSVPSFKFECSIKKSEDNFIKAETEVIIRQDLFNMPLTIMGKFWLK